MFVRKTYIGSPTELVAVRLWESEVHLRRRSDVVAKAASFEGTNVNNVMWWYSGDRGGDVAPNAEKLARISRAIPSLKFPSFDIREMSRGRGEPRSMLNLPRCSDVQITPPTKRFSLSIYLWGKKA